MIPLVLAAQQREVELGHVDGLHVVPGLAELANAAQGAYFGACGHEQLHVGVGADHGTDVTAIDYGAARARRLYSP